MGVNTPRTYGRYELLTELGRGGMAELHLARLSGIGGFSKLVAIKLMLPHLSSNPDFVELFLNEGRIAAQISHPNVCQVFEIGEVDGQLFLVMEYLEGVTWDELLKQMPADPAVTLRATAAVLAQIAEGLHHAHELRDAHGTATPVIHRDISPQNLFITTDGICKVLDFGVAKVANSASHTRTGVLKGKLPYMSPEQTKGEPLDVRSDVFSTGIVLWEALAKRPLFMRDAEFQVWLAITSEPIVPPSTFEPMYRDIDSVVMRALQRERMARFPSMRVFAEELRDAVEPYGGVMSVTELAAFVRERCDDKLVARSIELASLHTPQEVVASKRNDATVTDAPAIGSVMLRADSRILGRPRRRWPYAVAALAAIALAVVAVLGLRRDPPPTTAAVASVGPERSARIEPAPVEPAPVEPAPSEPAAIEPAPAEPVVEVAAPTPRSSPPAPRRRPAARIADARPTKVGTGTLSVDTRPTARVYIDGVFIDETPLFKHALPAGKHELRLVRGDTGVWRRTITIRTDQLTNLGNVQW